MGYSHARYPRLPKSSSERNAPSPRFLSYVRDWDSILQAWNSHPLRDSRYPFVVVDAIVLKMRDPDERVRAHAMMVATAVNEEGFRAILGLMIGDSGSEEGWLAFFSWLKQRGL